MRRPFLFGCLAMLMPTGCTVGPDYQAPEIVMPKGWRELDAAQGQSIANIPWWELYPDPVLHEAIQPLLADGRCRAIAFSTVPSVTEIRKNRRPWVARLASGVIELE